MPPQPLESRVKALETRVTRLEELPARMDRLESQIVQLRDENREEHTAIRVQIAAQIGAAHESLQADIQSVHEEMHAMHGTLRAETHALHAGLKMQLVEQERLTRVLHEDLVGRIAALGEGLPKRHDGNA